MIAALILSLAACSRDSARASRKLTSIDLACVMNPDFSLVHIAIARGFFADEGLIVNVKPFAIGKTALAAVISGEADLATSLETPVVFAILGGEEIQIVAAVATSDKNLVLVANRGAGVAKPGDLAGKKVGVTKGTAAEYFLSSFLVAHRISESGITPVDTQPDDLLDALMSRGTAAAVLWNPLTLQIGDVLGRQGLVFPSEDIYTAYDLVVGDRAFLEANPEAITSFIRALIRAETFFKKDFEKALSHIGEFTKSEEPALRASLDLYRYKVALDLSLLLVLEDESRWAMRIQPDAFKTMPKYLDYIFSEALSSVAPDRVRLVR